MDQYWEYTCQSFIHEWLVDTMQFYWSLSNTLCTLPISNPLQTPRFFLLEYKNERGVLISNCSKSFIFLFQWISVRVWLGITWVISSDNSETTCIAGFLYIKLLSCSVQYNTYAKDVLHSKLAAKILKTRVGLRIFLNACALLWILLIQPMYA